MYKEKKPLNVPMLLRIVGFVILFGSFVFFYITYKGSFGHFSIYTIVAFMLLGAGFILSSRFYSVNVTDTNTKVLTSEVDRVKYNYLCIVKRYVPISSPWFSIPIGALLIIADIFYQYSSTAHSGFGDMDIILIMIGTFVAAYPFIPDTYYLERDFIITFFTFLFLLMVLVPLLFSLRGDSFTYYFLLVPLHNVISFLGIENVILPPATLKITDPMSKIKADIVIARACSGIYSFSIFIAASVSFILVIYRKINWKSVLFIAFAIVLAYIGNVIRMTVVTLSGYYYGPATLSWVHETIGYPIFFAWMAFFWFILYRFLIKEDEEKDEKKNS